MANNPTPKGKKEKEQEEKPESYLHGTSKDETLKRQENNEEKNEEKDKEVEKRFYTNDEFDEQDSDGSANAFDGK